jgi:hypothetical protein
MSDSRQHAVSRKPARPSGLRRVTRARPIGDLIGKTLERSCRRRGFAAADLVVDWPEIVGERYAGKVQPLRVDWPRVPEGASDPEAQPATLVVQTDGATALLLTHDADQVVERINTFFGWGAIGRIRILQRPLSPAKRKRPAKPRPLTAEEETELAGKLADVGNARLEAALEKLGRAVIAKAR